MKKKSFNEIYEKKELFFTLNLNQMDVKSEDRLTTFIVYANFQVNELTGTVTANGCSSYNFHWI